MKQNCISPVQTVTVQASSALFMLCFTHCIFNNDPVCPLVPTDPKVHEHHFRFKEKSYLVKVESTYLLSVGIKKTVFNCDGVQFATKTNQTNLQRCLSTYFIVSGLGSVEMYPVLNSILHRHKCLADCNTNR